MIACAAPGYLARRGIPAHPQELETAHEMVGYFSPADGRPRSLLFTRGDERVEIKRAPAARGQRGQHLSAGGAAGFGVIQTWR